MLYIFEYMYKLCTFKYICIHFLFGELVVKQHTAGYIWVKRENWSKMLSVPVLLDCLRDTTHFFTQRTQTRTRFHGWGLGRQCHGLGLVILSLKRQTTQSGGQWIYSFGAQKITLSWRYHLDDTCEDQLIENLRVNEAILSISSKLTSKAEFGGI